MMIWHAKGLSDTTIGIEIEGNYPGIKGDMSTLWKGGGGPHTLNPNMMLAIEEVFIFLLIEFTRNGKTLDHIYAHRQSTNSRIADPGQEIWEAVAIPWEKRLGINLNNDLVFGTGRAIPKQWGGSAEYYEKRLSKRQV
jgi:hypothetical protein